MNSLDERVFVGGGNAQRVVDREHLLQERLLKSLDRLYQVLGDLDHRLANLTATLTAREDQEDRRLLAQLASGLFANKYSDATSDDIAQDAQATLKAIDAALYKEVHDELPF